ncbi:hypothetical protein KM043_000854 [Ampulex compressa]|nr:hypothetical protein KM043_000854 [Ampulex compressa]
MSEGGTFRESARATNDEKRREVSEVRARSSNGGHDKLVAKVTVVSPYPGGVSLQRGQIPVGASRPANYNAALKSWRSIGNRWLAAGRVERCESIVGGNVCPMNFPPASFKVCANYVESREERNVRDSCSGGQREEGADLGGGCYGRVRGSLPARRDLRGNANSRGSANTPGTLSKSDKFRGGGELRKTRGGAGPS